VLDGRFDAVRCAEVARLIARLGLEGVWLRQPALTGPGPEDPAALLSRLGADAGSAHVGIIVDTDAADASMLDSLTGAYIAGARPAGQADSPAAAPNISGLRIALTGTRAGLDRWLGRIEDRPLLGAEIALPAAMARVPPAPGMSGAVFVPFSAARDLDQAISAAARRAAGRPVQVEVAVSVGRTMAEARARADAEELFAIVGHPGRTGLFGTLEECQADAARLAHAGATELVCHLPHSDDLADVLAQLRAIAVGAGMLRPGEPPSVPPAPPAGWGGRRAVS
jgi:hypothetical protein